MLHAMLSVNPIARVVVNTVRASASPTAFDTGLLLVRDANYAAIPLLSETPDRTFDCTAANLT